LPVALEPAVPDLESVPRRVWLCAVRSTAPSGGCPWRQTSIGFVIFGLVVGLAGESVVGWILLMVERADDVWMS
jgi:hypothetical protein